MIVRFVYIGWIDDSDYAHIWTKVSTREGKPNLDQLSCHSFVTHHEIMPTFEPRSIPEGAWPNHDQLSCHSFLNTKNNARGVGGVVTYVDLLKELPHKGGSGCNRHCISEIAWFFVFGLLLFIFVCPSVTSLFVASPAYPVVILQIATYLMKLFLVDMPKEYKNTNERLEKQVF